MEQTNYDSIYGSGLNPALLGRMFITNPYTITGDAGAINTYSGSYHNLINPSTLTGALRPALTVNGMQHITAHHGLTGVSLCADVGSTTSFINSANSLAVIANAHDPNLSFINPSGLVEGRDGTVFSVPKTNTYINRTTGAIELTHSGYGLSGVIAANGLAVTSNTASGVYGSSYLTGATAANGLTIAGNTASGVYGSSYLTGATAANGLTVTGNTVSASCGGNYLTGAYASGALTVPRTIELTDPSIGFYTGAAGKIRSAVTASGYPCATSLLSGGLTGPYRIGVNDYSNSVYGSGGKISFSGRDSTRASLLNGAISVPNSFGTGLSLYAVGGAGEIRTTIPLTISANTFSGVYGGIEVDKMGRITVRGGFDGLVVPPVYEKPTVTEEVSINYKLIKKLALINASVEENYRGAVYVLNSKGPDYVRHMSVSLRQMFDYLVMQLPNKQALIDFFNRNTEKFADAEKYGTGDPEARNNSRVAFLFLTEKRPGSLTDDEFIKLYRKTNKGVHRFSEGYPHEIALDIFRRSEIIVLYILEAHEAVNN
jgi:hypothetical protein